MREKADRPFRCLDGQYRRELIRVYLSNVEQICRRFIDERRSKLSRLIEDKLRWSRLDTPLNGISFLLLMMSIFVMHNFGLDEHIFL